MRKFDKGNHGLSPAAVDTILKDGHLSQSERTLFKAVADYQKQIASDLREQAHHADSTAFLPETAATLNGSQLAAVLRRWAVGETRSDSQNNEQLLFNAIEGYEGQGIGIKSNDRFAREMDDKDQSQLNADSRAHDFHRVPHFPEVRQ
jgi:transposase-like protein